MLNRIRDIHPHSCLQAYWFVRIRNPFDFAGVNGNADDLRSKMDSIKNKNEGDNFER